MHHAPGTNLLLYGLATRTMILQQRQEDEDEEKVTTPAPPPPAATQVGSRTYGALARNYEYGSTSSTTVGATITRQCSIFLLVVLRARTAVLVPGTYAMRVSRRRPRRVPPIFVIEWTQWFVRCPPSGAYRFTKIWCCLNT